MLPQSASSKVSVYVSGKITKIGLHSIMDSSLSLLTPLYSVTERKKGGGFVLAGTFRRFSFPNLREILPVLPSLFLFLEGGLVVVWGLSQADFLKETIAPDRLSVIMLLKFTTERSH